jgi:phosphatidylinositol alpha-1,6-mannosyltransferase
MKENLILFSYDYPPSNGGIARLCQEIAARAKQYYEKVIVLTREKAIDRIPYNYHEVEIVNLPARRIKCEIAAIRYLRKIENKKEVDVLCGIWHPEGLLSLLAGFKNIYILGHGTEFLFGKSTFRKYFWLPVYAKFILNRGSKVKVIANSHYTAGLVSRITGKADVIALPLAVNHTFFQPLSVPEKNSDVLKLCSVSRILQFKGHDFILKTIAGLPVEYLSRIRYDIAGTGQFLPSLKQLARELNMENIVSFKGFVPDSELPGFYNQHDAFILCTRESKDSTAVEGFGLVFLEAQACGIPAIGTATGGIPDAVEDGNGGWLMRQDDRENLSSLLMNLIDNPALAKQMGEKARKKVESSSTWELYCEKLFKLLSL